VVEYKIVVIGLGGVGSVLIEKIGRFLNFAANTQADITLVDGDAYEVKNYERQEFGRVGSKAEIKAKEIGFKFKNLRVSPINLYIDPMNVSSIIQDGHIVFLCVDNHKTRMIVSNYCKTLRDITLISGGNELTDGNVQIYVKKGGVDLTPDLCSYHPEIANPADKLPSEMTCEELAHSEPQLFFANIGVAFFMCCAFYRVVIKGIVDDISESYFDIMSMCADAKRRTVRS
jgi:molybdopterin/thiamine biosynthesis adenylyltransferase